MTPFSTALTDPAATGILPHAVSVLTTGAGIAPVPVVSWLLAVSPVVLLLALVLWGRHPMTTNAAVTVVAAVVVSAAAFGAGPLAVAVGLGKGAWVGVWILYVIWPALLMHHLATQLGMESLGRVLSGVLPHRSENVLLLAWVLPSFIQGVSGFGTPIAVAAPLLLALGVSSARAVALPLIGYHWAVGFGSMGSSFYMGALTAHLDAAGTREYATAASLALGINCVLSGVLVTLMDGGLRGLRGAWLTIVTVGPAMAVVQALVVRLEPSIGALCAGGAGLATVFLLRTVRGGGRARPAPREATGDEATGDEAIADEATGLEVGPEDRSKAWAAAVPYALLALVALAVFLPPSVRDWAKSHLLLGPSFPLTRAGDGVENAAVHTYNPIAMGGHPGTFLLIACAGSALWWRLRGQWPRGAWAPTLRGVWKQARKSSPSIILLASVAGILVDSGMVHTVASGAAAATGPAYPVIAPLVGALGSFITGSTTSSNALFSALQSDVAHLIDVPAADLLAGQLAGGNIGNSLAPVVIVLGLSAVGAARSAGRVLRMTLLPAGVLLASTIATTTLVVALHS